jgi:hypothetical protein
MHTLILSEEAAVQHVIMNEAVMVHLIVFFNIPLRMSHAGYR